MFVDDGRTVLVSSHLLAELGQIVDDVILIDHGRLIARGSAAELMANHRAASLENCTCIVTKGPGRDRAAVLGSPQTAQHAFLLDRRCRRHRSVRVIGYAEARIASDAGEPLSLSAVAAAPAQATWFLGIVLAVVASAGEFQHRSIRTTLLASPHRVQVLIARASSRPPTVRCSWCWAPSVRSSRRS